MIHALAGLAFLGAGLAASKWGSLVDLIDRARSQGWIVEKTKSNHWKFIPPDKTKQIVIVASTPSDHRARQNEMARLKRSGLSGSRVKWDAARYAQTRPRSKTFKPGPFDHWTDDELWTKAQALIMGPTGTYDEGAWYDLDQAYTLGNRASRGPVMCRQQDQYIRRAVESIRLAKRIFDTGRLMKHGRHGMSAIDFNLLAQRVKEAIDAHDASCPRPYDGPTFP